MEKCEKIEERLVDGARQLIFYYNSKNLLLNEKSAFKLLIEFGSISTVKEYFKDFIFNDMEHFFNKNQIKYEIA